MKFCARPRCCSPGTRYVTPIRLVLSPRHCHLPRLCRARKAWLTCRDQLPVTWRQVAWKRRRLCAGNERQVWSREVIGRCKTRNHKETREKGKLLNRQLKCHHDSRFKGQHLVARAFFLNAARFYNLIVVEISLINASYQSCSWLPNHAWSRIDQPSWLLEVDIKHDRTWQSMIS